MAESRRHALGNQVDIEQILLEAQHRWLRPAEICEILRNYKKFRISSEPAHMPPSGSLFLFDRKVLRYFRKDGHSWRKKKDGKTVKEAHERLKAGSVDVLHCYYAHGEEDENFQRRSYWMLEDELSHMVLVHYREVKGNRSNFSRSKEKEDAIHYSHESEEFIANPEIDSSTSSIFHPNNYQVPLQTTDTTSLNSAQASEYEDAESAYNHQASSRFQPFLELQQPVMEKIDAGLSNSHHPVHFPNDYPGKFSYSSGTDFISTSRSGNNDGLTYEPLKHLNFQSWGDLMENTSSGIHPVAFQQSDFCTEADGIRTLTRQGNDMSSNVFMDNLGKRHELQEEGQISAGDFLDLPKWSVFQKKYPTSAYNLTAEFHETHPDEPTDYPLQWDLQEDLSGAEHGSYVKSEVESNLATGGKTEYSAILKRSLLDGSLTEEGLKKLDSFNRWMSKELGDVDESVVQSCSEALWDTVDNENVVTDSGLPQTQLDTCVVGPSLSQDQLFSIIDFSPNWVYAGSEIKVLITGRFLRNQQDVEECKWSCMFGEVEVPAEVIADGVLRCHAPLHQAGRVPFYVTCSNRLACSEVREFEYRVKSIHDVSMEDTYNGSMSESLLRMRFVKLLSSESECSFDSISINMPEKSNLRSKISSLMKEDGGEWDQMLTVTSEDFSLSEIKEQLLQKLLKEKLHAWLLHKTAEGGKGPSILDESGQGVLHFAAALGYDWAILPTIVAGVSVNFRDVNGWTALHWAASRGRERTVVSLISLGAAPGALTDPTPKYPSGRTPADLASANRHKGIAGYLAESSLSAQLEILDLKEMKDSDSVHRSGVKAVQTVSERVATPNQDGDLPYGLSLKDSLEAVRNATQAAARIHQVFRVHSFQQKKLREYGDNKCGISDERALSLVMVKTQKPGQSDQPVYAAAIRIQNKFRSWKGRKEFLMTRQRIIKIQAHVRGHQVRKNYGNIIWSVGILEKVVLRWRRKGSGLRGFRSEALVDSSSMQDTPSKDDDYDFLKEGRKQTEERYQKALSRVKSMVQYPEARDQYRRLLTAVSEIHENKAKYDRVVDSSDETADFDEELVDLETLLGDDTFMPTAT